VPLSPSSVAFSGGVVVAEPLRLPGHTGIAEQDEASDAAAKVLSRVRFTRRYVYIYIHLSLSLSLSLYLSIYIYIYIYVYIYIYIYLSI